MPPAHDTRFVLVGTSHAGNVGAAARAMKVMGFDDLVLVAPRFADVHRQPEAIAFASGATDVLARVRVVKSLVEALDGVAFSVATAMTPRDFGPPTHAPRAWFLSLAAQGHRVAFVFGSERFGMANSDVYQCHACVSIPTAGGYGSLNLAQAVQLLAYEWREAIGGFDVLPRTPVEPLADAPAIEGLLAHWQATLTRLGYFDPAVPRKLMARLRRLVHRARPTVDELQILRGIARSIDQAAPAPRPSSLGDKADPA